MKKFFTLIVAVIAAATALSAQTISKSYNLSGFDAIAISYIYDVQITEGNSDLLEVTCPEAVAQYLNIYVSDGTLHMEADRIPMKLHKTLNNIDITVTLQMNKLNSISMTGASSLKVNGEYDSDKFRLSMSGASELKSPLHINATHFNATLSGACQAEVYGTFGNIHCNISGAADIEINGNAKTAIINASGAADVEYSGNISQICKVECVGAAETTLEGSVPAIEIKCSGAAEVDAEKMIAKTATAAASGASSIKVYGDDLLNLETTGGSKIRYYGKAKQLNLPKDNSIARGGRN